MRSQRQLRVGEEIRHALAEVFQRGDVPWPAGSEPPVITVAEVQVSPDLKNATAFIMPLGGIRLEETVKVLNNHLGFFRHELARKVKLRHVPKIKFSPDRSFDNAQRISELLNDPVVAKDLDKE
jgi:ribosome-binding factor A